MWYGETYRGVNIDVANNVLDAALKISFFKANLYVTYILQRWKRGKNLLSLLLFQLLLLFGVFLIFILLTYGYLEFDYIAMIAMMVLTIFFAYIYYLLIFNKDDKDFDKKRVLWSSAVFFPGIILMIYFIIKIFINFY